MADQTEGLPSATGGKGGGATFVVFLPLAKEANTPMTHNPVKMAKATRKLETNSS